MKLSVVIVNYNVKHFLEQALLSVEQAMHGIDGEVFVVDNNSVDDSVQMVKEKFPNVELIENKDNPGFSIANNQAIHQSSGEYVLLLNPDTVVEEDTFRICLDFMDAHLDVGGLGVKMIDGSGRFLPESKRGLPSPKVAFFKMFGLSWLFPKTKMFNHYHLGYLDQNETHEIEVLAGAFMWLRKSVLDKTGLLDEAFFMYGEDIDLSYRIIKAGFKNYYLPTTKIIHYKGESTKKGSLNYVKTFYNAMIIFAQKHFSGRQARTFTFLIRIAIFFRAALTLLNSWVKKLIWPLLDFFLLWLGLILLKNFWAQFHFGDANYYQDSVTYINLPIYSLFWVLSIVFNGGYDPPIRIGRLLRGVLFGTLIIAAIYGFLNLDYRSSRSIILMGSVWAMVGLSAVRIIRHYLAEGNLKIGSEKLKRVAIVGSVAEYFRANLLLDKAGVQKEIVGRVAIAEIENAEHPALGQLEQLSEIRRVRNIHEFIFCSSDISAQDIMGWMTSIGNVVDYKILPKESESIIGSSSKNVAGELYTIDIQYQINTPEAKRNKRLFDFIVSLLLLIIGPVLCWFTKSPAAYFSNVFGVLLGSKSWVGYSKLPQPKLPSIRPGVLSAQNIFSGQQYPEEDRRLDFYYARDYSLNKDIEIIWKGWRYLGS